MELTIDEIKKILMDLDALANQVREINNELGKFDTRIITINERTKNHTIDIKNIEKRLK